MPAEPAAPIADGRAAGNQPAGKASRAGSPGGAAPAAPLARPGPPLVAIAALIAAAAFAVFLPLLFWPSAAVLWARLCLFGALAMVAAAGVWVWRIIVRRAGFAQVVRMHFDLPACFRFYRAHWDELRRPVWITMIGLGMLAGSQIGSLALVMVSAWRVATAGQRAAGDLAAWNEAHRPPPPPRSPPPPTPAPRQWPQHIPARVPDRTPATSVVAGPLRIPPNTSAADAYAAMAAHFGADKVVRVVIDDPDRRADSADVERLLHVCSRSPATSAYVARTDEGLLGLVAPADSLQDAYNAFRFVSTRPRGAKEIARERDEAAHMLTLHVPHSDAPGGQRYLSSNDEKAIAAIEALRAPLVGSRDHDAAVKALEPHLASRSDEVRIAAAGALASWKNPDDIPRMLRLLDDPAERVRALTIAGLGLMRDERAVRALVKCLNAPPRQGSDLCVYQDYSYAETCLKNMGPDCEPYLVEYLRREGNTATGEASACYVLGEVGGRASLSVLRTKARDKRPYVGVHARVAYQKITPRLSGMRTDDPDWDDFHDCR
jgi:hypothetical protein